MLERTKTRLTKERKRQIEIQKIRTQRKSTSWRAAYRKEIEKFTEAGYALRCARKNIGLTQKEVAKSLEIKQSHISEMENGKRTIGKTMAKRFGAFFKKDYRCFL